MENSEILIYQSEDGNTKVEVRMEGESVWLARKEGLIIKGYSVKHKLTFTSEIEKA